MRYIDIKDLYAKKSDWDLKASEVWKDKNLKEDFKAYFHYKCWYTECSLRGSDAHIDHFYPKAGNTPYKSYLYNNLAAADGYTWLKNNFENYRVACAYSNRGKGKGGKKAYFPLQAGSPLLINDGTAPDFDKEKPMLLDPLKKDDVKLLAFTRDKIECSTENNKLDEERVEVSKNLYNLDQHEFKDARVKIYDRIEYNIKRFKRRKCTMCAKQSLIEDLRGYIDIKEPFSAYAISIIKQLLADRVDILSKLELEL